MTHHDVNQILEIAAHCAKTHPGRNQIENIQICSEYQEPGYSQPDSGIALGNWNAITQYDEKTRTFICLDDTPKRLASILERLGFELEWDDEWERCSSCDGLVRTQPDSYSWRPSYVKDHGDTICLECLDKEQHLENLEGNGRSCNQIASVDPSEHGYLLIQDGFEHGFHAGMDASPKNIADILRKIGAKRFIFNQDDQSQFYITFSVWLHEEEGDLLKAAKRALKSGNTDGPSVSEGIKRGLQEAALQSSALSGEGVRYSEVCADGTAKTRIISPQEFVVDGVKK